MNRMRVAVGALVSALCLVPCAAPAASGTPSGEGLRELPSDVQAWYGSCSFVIGTAAVGGADLQGFGPLWLIKADPATSPEGGPTEVPCTFDVTATFDVQGGGPPLRQRLTGDDEGTRFYRTMAGHPDDRTKTRPRDLTVVVCRRDGGCSTPHTGEG